MEEIIDAKRKRLSEKLDDSMTLDGFRER